MGGAVGADDLQARADTKRFKLFRVAPEDVAEARALDAAEPGEGWTCFGGTGIGARSGAVGQLRSASAWIAAWAPGVREALADKGTGYLLEAGSQIGMQVHYNLLASDGQTGADQSMVRLRLVNGDASSIH